MMALAILPFAFIWGIVAVNIRDSKDKTKKKELLGCPVICLRGDYKGQKGIILDLYRKKVFSSEPPFEVRVQVPLAVADVASGKEEEVDVEIILLLDEVKLLNEVKVLKDNPSETKLKGQER